MSSLILAMMPTREMAKCTMVGLFHVLKIRAVWRLFAMRWPMRFRHNWLTRSIMAWHQLPPFMMRIIWPFWKRLGRIGHLRGTSMMPFPMSGQRRVFPVVIRRISVHGWGNMRFHPIPRSRRVLGRLPIGGRKPLFRPRMRSGMMARHPLP